MTVTGPSDGVTYAEVGATLAAELPPGYRHIDRRRVVGAGEACFARVTDEVLTWGLHRRAGLKPVASAPRAAPGVDVTVRAGLGPLRVAAGCRVVAVVEDATRQGFAYGTLPGHPERGEELFCAELRHDGAVLVHVRAFSRHATWWSRAAGPAVRLGQHVITERYLRALG